MWSVFYSLHEAGAEIPKAFPEEIDFDCEMVLKDNDGSEELFLKLTEENAYSSVIYEILRACAQHYDFYIAYIHDIEMDETMDSYFEEIVQIKSCLVGLALAKVGNESTILPKFGQFKFEVLSNYRKWIEPLKEAAYKNKIPLRAELMHLASEDPGFLHEAEAEAFGFNSTRIHPDIYMNEILEGMRLVHQVLPAICNKLGITEDELKIDESMLRV